MKYSRIPKILIAFAAVALLAALPALAKPTGVPVQGKTLENLQAAFDGETSTYVRYMVFARKADEEGYGAVASLFRATALAEQVHAANHGWAIRELGGVPVAKVDGPVVKSTRENLEAALQAEIHERDQMYPDFIAEARASGNREVTRTFTYARRAEAEHARLYADALKNLDRLKDSKAVTYYVCKVCGFTAKATPLRKCPSCFNRKEKYVEVS